MVKSLPELLPFPKTIVAEEFEAQQTPLDFGNCKKCGKPYQIYHINGVCFDCDIDRRMKEEPEFREAIEATARSY